MDNSVQTNNTVCLVLPWQLVSSLAVEGIYFVFKNINILMISLIY